MNTLRLTAYAVSALTVYIWLACYVWHILPDAKNEWWVMPAVLTTILLGFATYLGAEFLAATHDD